MCWVWADGWREPSLCICFFPPRSWGSSWSMWLTQGKGCKWITGSMLWVKELIEREPAPPIFPSPFVYLQLVQQLAAIPIPACAGAAALAAVWGICNDFGMLPTFSWRLSERERNWQFLCISANSEWSFLGQRKGTCIAQEDFPSQISKLSANKGGGDLLKEKVSNILYNGKCWAT